MLAQQPVAGHLTAESPEPTFPEPTSPEPSSSRKPPKPLAPGAWVKQAQTLYQAGQFTDAAEAWQRAVTEFATDGDPLNQAVALGNLALTKQQLGQWPEAMQAIDQGLEILSGQPQSLTQQSIQASSLDIKGQFQLAAGHPDLALKLWEQAHTGYQSIGNSLAATTNRINQAQALQDLGRYPKACELLLEVLSLPHQSCELPDVVIHSPSMALPQNVLAYRSLGNVLRIMGQLEQSYQILQIGLAAAQTQNDTTSLAPLYLSMGNTLRALSHQAALEVPRHRDWTEKSTVSRTCLAPLSVGEDTSPGLSLGLSQQAANCYQLAADITTSPTGQIQAEINLLNLWVQHRLKSGIPGLISRLQAQLTNLPPSKTAITSQLKLAQNLICLRSTVSQLQAEQSSPILQACLSLPSTITGNRLDLTLTQIPDWPQIQHLVTRALEQARLLLDLPSQSNALGYLAAIAQQQGNLREAQHLTEQALQSTSAFDRPELAYLWRWQLGRLYQIQGQKAAAITAYTAAFDTLQTLRQELVTATRDVQFNFRDSVEPIYRELVDLLLQAPDPSPSELQQAWDILEALQLAELNNFFKEACFQARRTSIDKIDPESAVIYTVILPHRLGLIVAFPGEPLAFYATPLKPQSQNETTQFIEHAVRELRKTLDPIHSKLKPYQQFYDWLIRPVEADLIQHKTKTLIFILDGVLRQVPLSALHDGDQYLIEKYRIAITPSLQLLQTSSNSSKGLKTLAAGLGAARQNFLELPGVLEEVRGITEIVPSHALLDQEFIRSRLQNELSATAFSIVHLATHGQFSSRAKDTFLLTWDERINVKQLSNLLPEHRENSKNALDLLILSACQTASGDQRSVLGLAGIAVRTGARSTLGTIWSVKDESTAKFILEFYRRYAQPGVSKAEALRQAQLSFVHSPQYQHPVYWAAFVLIGNWI